MNILGELDESYDNVYTLLLIEFSPNLLQWMMQKHFFLAMNVDLKEKRL